MLIDHILEKFNEAPAFLVYKKKVTKERKNGTRTFFNVVHKPNEVMFAVHQGLIKVLVERLSPLHQSLPNAIAIGGVASQGIFYNLERARHITKLDLFHAYGSVKVSLLAGMLKELFPGWGSEKQIAIFLRKHCCNDKLGLFWGAPASPLLFNLYCERLIDVKIRKISPVGYMRYVDDFIFFSDGEVSKDFLSSVRRIIKESGFFENQWKAKSVDRKQGSIIVLGRELGCLAPVIKMEGHTFQRNKAKRYKKLDHAVDPVFGGVPRRVVGMPSHFPENKSLANLEREMYRASCGLEVKNPMSLYGRMIWFVHSVHPQNRKLSRTERKLVAHFRKWARATDQKTNFLKKLNIVVNS